MNIMTDDFVAISDRLLNSILHLDKMLTEGSLFWKLNRYYIVVNDR